MSRRAKVAALYLRGTTNQLDICAKLGMEATQQGMISRDLKWLYEQWKTSGMRDLDAAKGKELDRLDLVEAAAWDGLERSKADRESNRTRRGKRGRTHSQDDEVKKEKRDGDPRWLAIILDCIKQRCAILGLAELPEALGGGTMELVHKIVVKRADMPNAAAADQAAPPPRSIEHAGPAK